MDGTGKLFAGIIHELSETCEMSVVVYPVDRHLCDSELVELIRSCCSVSEPYVLLAESFSAPIAIVYAASNPLNMKGLIICAGFAASPVSGWKRYLGHVLAPLLFRTWMPRAAINRWLLGPGASPALLSAVRMAIASVKPQVLAARFRSVLACDVRLDLARIGVPILYLQARQDRLVKPVCLEGIRLIQPGIEVVAVDGPHLLLQKEPQRVVEAIVRFTRAARRT